MSKPRIINGIIAIAIAIITTSMTIYYWKLQGCGFYSLAAAAVMYNGIIAAIWQCVDDCIKSKEAK